MVYPYTLLFQFVLLFKFDISIFLNIFIVGVVLLTLITEDVFVMLLQDSSKPVPISRQIDNGKKDTTKAIKKPSKLVSYSFDILLLKHG